MIPRRTDVLAVFDRADALAWIATVVVDLCCRALRLCRAVVP